MYLSTGGSISGVQYASARRYMIRFGGSVNVAPLVLGWLQLPLLLLAYQLSSAEEHEELPVPRRSHRRCTQREHLPGPASIPTTGATSTRCCEMSRLVPRCVSGTIERATVARLRTGMPPGSGSSVRFLQPVLKFRVQGDPQVSRPVQT